MNDTRIAEIETELARLDTRIRVCDITEGMRYVSFEQHENYRAERTAHRAAKTALAAELTTLKELVVNDNTAQFTSEAALVEALNEQPSNVLRDGEGHVLDPQRAWAVYAADPAHFHQATQDNPDGNPIFALVGEDGPHWVTRAAADGVYEIHTAVRNDATGAWETIEIERATRAEFDRAEVSAQDIGGEPGLELRLELIDPDLDGDARVLATREIETS